MRLQGDRGFLDLCLSELGPRGTPGDSDLLLNVTVQVGGYSAADQAWVVAEDYARFLNDLQGLEEQRQGCAALEGASPDDLRIEVYSTDSLGHMALRGYLGWRSPAGHMLQLRFGLGFEPDRLPQLLSDLRALVSQSPRDA